jgi:cell wall-associated NlpC family hydrolase
MPATLPNRTYRLVCCVANGTALALGLVGCGSAPVKPTSRGADVEIFEPIPGRLSPEQANDVTLYALGLVGTPYKYGGNTPESGFDCSGLITYVFQTRVGITPPRTTAELSFWGRMLPQEQLRSGDLVLFGKGTLANHAGIYVGGGRFVHAPATGGMVRLDRIDSGHWEKQSPRFRRP